MTNYIIYNNTYIKLWQAHFRAPLRCVSHVALCLLLDLFTTNLEPVIFLPLKVTSESFFLSCSPVEKVKTQWESTQHGVELRRQQLEDMVVDSLQWDDHREETEELMRKYEARFYMLQQARRDPLSKQVSDNQVRFIA